MELPDQNFQAHSRDIELGNLGSYVFGREWDLISVTGGLQFLRILLHFGFLEVPHSSSFQVIFPRYMKNKKVAGSS